MNFAEILELKNGVNIQKLEGKITAIYGKTPTPAQKAKGIIPQDVVLQGDDGVKVRLVIMNDDMHLPPDAVGRRFVFESTPNDKGQPSGVSKNVYGNYHTVQVYRDAVITGDKAMPSVSKAQDRMKEAAREVPMNSGDEIPNTPQ